MSTIAVHVRVGEIPSVHVYRDDVVIITGTWPSLAFTDLNVATEEEYRIARALCIELDGPGRIAEIPEVELSDEDRRILLEVEQVEDGKLEEYLARLDEMGRGYALHIRCEACSDLYPKRGRLPEHCACGARLLWDDEAPDDPARGRIIWWRRDA